MWASADWWHLSMCCKLLLEQQVRRTIRIHSPGVPATRADLSSRVRAALRLRSAGPTSAVATSTAASSAAVGGVSRRAASAGGESGGAAADARRRERRTGRAAGGMAGVVAGDGVIPRAGLCVSTARVWVIRP